MRLFFIALISLVMVISVAGQNSDSTKISNVLNNFVDAWNKHDVKAFSMEFAEDADFTNVRGVSAHGRAAIEKFHTQPFATWFKNSNLKITDKKIRFITPDIAAVDAWWEMTGSQSPDGQDIPLRKGLLNLLMTRSGERWVITVMHNLDLPVK